MKYIKYLILVVCLTGCTVALANSCPSLIKCTTANNSNSCNIPTGWHYSYGWNKVGANIFTQVGANSSVPGYVTCQYNHVFIIASNTSNFTIGAGPWYKTPLPNNPNWHICNTKIPGCFFNSN